VRDGTKQTQAAEVPDRAIQAADTPDRDWSWVEAPRVRIVVASI